MILLLLHGRDNPAQDMDEIGNGFVAEPIMGVKYIHATYLSDFNIGFNSVEEAKTAATQTGWEAFFEDAVLTMKVHEDMIEASGTIKGWFGDWELMEKFPNE